MPGGRPSKYKKAYCDAVIKHCAKGLSFECFAAQCHVSKETIYTWTEKHKEFLDAKKKGEAKCQEYWEKLGLAGTVGKLKGFNAAMWIFNMKNRFGWTDKHEINSGNGTFTFSYEK
jgi:hypothetical protein